MSLLFNDFQVEFISSKWIKLNSFRKVLHDKIILDELMGGHKLDELLYFGRGENRLELSYV